MAEFHFITSGNMTIELRGLCFGRHIRDPRGNIKSYITNDHQIELDASDQSDFTGEGIIELLDEGPGRGTITVTIDSPNMGWYGTAQIALYVNGSNILNDNFQSGVRGPFGDPRKTKVYPVGSIS